MVAPVVDLTARGVWSRKFFPVSGIPTQLGVLHSAECPLRGGYARSLSEWFSATQYPAYPEASWQRFVDPIARVRAIPDELGAWHASEANPLSIGWEQAGYARFTRAEWTTPLGMVQLDNLAYDMAEVAMRDGLEPRWLSTAEVRAVLDGGNRVIKGFCTHRQIDPETRTDPGDGYPYDLLMTRIRHYMAGATPAPETEWWNMTIPKAQLLQIAAAVNNQEFRTAIRDEILAAPIMSTDGKEWPLEAHVRGNTARTVELGARLAGMEELLRQTAEAAGTDIDYDRVGQVFRDALKDSTVQVDVTVVGGQPAVPGVAL